LDFVGVAECFQPVKIDDAAVTSLGLAVPAFAEDGMMAKPEMAKPHMMAKPHVMVVHHYHHHYHHHMASQTKAM
jgi:hypothetical protein